VLNSLAFGRRLALRLLLWQLVAAMIVGLAFLVHGIQWAIAAAAGAAVVALGNAMLAARVFRGVAPAGVVYGRLLAGVILKWVVVIGGFFAILVKYKLPPLAALTGLGAALAVNLLALRFKG
jgi:ATP synthase protein I